MLFSVIDQINEKHHMVKQMTYKKFEESKTWHIQKWSYLIFSIPTSIFFQQMLIRSTISDFSKSIIDEFIYGIILILLFFINEFVCILLIIALQRDAVIVEFYENRIMGYPRYGKKHFEIEYNKIIAIQSSWLVLTGVVLIDKDNNKYIISTLISNFRECIETIISNSTNIQKINIKAIKNTKAVWK